MDRGPQLPTRAGLQEASGPTHAQARRTGSDGGPEDVFHQSELSAWNAAAHLVDEQIAGLRAAALHEYRDEERRARLDRARTLASEGWAHRLWRWLSGSTPPELQTSSQAEPVIDSWRKQSQMSGAGSVWPEDATKRTLADALRSVRPTGP